MLHPVVEVNVDYDWMIESGVTGCYPVVSDA
jgi:hypothetical protein